jgi:hypothetical protein
VLLFNQIPLGQLPVLVRSRSWTVKDIEVQLILRSLQFPPGEQCHALEVALQNDHVAAKKLGFVG